MEKKAKETVGGARRGTRRQPDRMYLQFVVVPGCPLQHVEAMRDTAPYKEYYEEISIRLFNVWSECQSLTLPEGRSEAGLLSVEIDFAEPPRAWPVAAGAQLLDELAAHARLIFLGSRDEPRPVVLAVARAKMAFQPLPVLDLLAALSKKETLEDNKRIIHYEIVIVDETPDQDKALQSLTEQFTSNFVSRLKRLIPLLPQDPEAKAQALIALNRSFDEAFWTAVRGELTPLIKPLLQDVPSDYDGKRARAALINAVLSAYGLAIQIEDDHGRRHLCSLYAVRARESDGKGNLRLLERTASGSSRRSYSIPAPDHLQLVETPRDEPNLKSQSADRDRTC